MIECIIYHDIQGSGALWNKPTLFPGRVSLEATKPG